MIAAFRGQRRGADARLETALFQVRACGTVPVEFHLLWAKALLAEFDGRDSVAADTYRDLRALWLETEDRACAVPGLVSAAAFYADRREATALAACSEILGLIARENNNDETCAARQAALAESAYCHGDTLRAVEAMKEALSGYDRLGTSLEMALVRCRFGRMLVAAGQPREAEKSRREASEIARRLGLRPLLDRLRDDAVAHASAAEPKAPQPRVAAGLTPRQRAIVGLIAKGLTNKEIASHLNLSPRTVEMHVALALERLNCRTRSEAVSRATAQGLLEGPR
jgi:DNA-binding NarL/FixJ family response regulator